MMDRRRASRDLSYLLGAAVVFVAALAGTAGAALNDGRFGRWSGRRPDGRLIVDPAPTPVPPPPEPEPSPDLARPGLAIVDRSSSSITLAWCDRSQIDTGNHLWRTTDAEVPFEYPTGFTGGVFVASFPGSPNGCREFVDGALVPDVSPPVAAAQALSPGALHGLGLQPDTFYCYQVAPHRYGTEFGDYLSSVHCAFTRENPKRSLWRAQLVLRTSGGGSDGTDDPVEVELNRPFLGYNYEHLAGYALPFGNVTRLDRPGDDHERGAVEVYDLNLSNLSDMGDITQIGVRKDGDDDWCLDGMALLVNEETVFEKSFSPCKRATGDSVLFIPHEELRAFPAWSSYRSNLIPADAAQRLLAGETVRILQIARGDLEKRVEGIVGHVISGNSLEWGGLGGGGFVEATPVDGQTLHVDLDLVADVTGPNPTVDVDFDLRFAMACEGSGVDFTIETPPGSFQVEADSSLTTDVLAGLFCSGIDGFVGQDCPVAVESAIESQIRSKFSPIAQAIRFDLGGAAAACGTSFRPVARVTPGGALVIEVESLIDPSDPGPQPTPAPSPQPTPAPTPAGAPEVGIVTSVLRLTDDATPPVEPNLRRLAFRSNSTEAAPSGVVEPPFDSAADPTIAGAELVVYQVGGEPSEVARLELPANRWRRVGTAGSPGYAYADAQRADGPITSARVQNGDLVINGRGEGLFPLAGAPQGQMALRLRLGDGDVWCASAPAKPPLAANDTTAKFVGAPSPAPMSCPPVPGVVDSALRAFLDRPADLLR